jgi:hypothetical protein
MADYRIYAVDAGSVVDCGGTSCPRTLKHEVDELQAMGLPVKVKNLRSGELAYHPSQLAWQAAVAPNTRLLGATLS